MTVLRHKTPCKGCPWQRRSLAGWLGGYAAEWFTERVMKERPLTCHQSLDDEKTDFMSEDDIIATFPLCAGALIVQRNMGKLPRDPEHAAAVRAVEKSEAVFNHPMEFTAHHAQFPVRHTLPR